MHQKNQNKTGFPAGFFMPETKHKKRGILSRPFYFIFLLLLRKTTQKHTPQSPKATP
jgi:hypothetical protein